MKAPSPYDGRVYVYRLVLPSGQSATADVANFATLEAAVAYGRALSRGRGGSQIEIWCDHRKIETVSDS